MKTRRLSDSCLLIEEAPVLVDEGALLRLLFSMGKLEFRMTPKAEEAVFSAMETLLINGDVTFVGENYKLVCGDHPVDENSAFGFGDTTPGADIDLPTLWEKFIYDTELDPVEFPQWVRETFPQYQHLLDAAPEHHGQQYTVPSKLRNQLVEQIRQHTPGHVAWPLVIHQQVDEATIRELADLYKGQGIAGKWIKRVLA